MKDMNDLTHSFPEWNALLDFLSGFTPKDTVRDIHITREGTKGWATRINGTNVKSNPQRKAISGAALYDLYW